jgi:hypothetical protein
LTDRNSIFILCLPMTGIFGDLTMSRKMNNSHWRDAGTRYESGRKPLVLTGQRTNRMP